MRERTLGTQVCGLPDTDLANQGLEAELRTERGSKYISGEAAGCETYCGVSRQIPHPRLEAQSVAEPDSLWQDSAVWCSGISSVF